jgi:hypothetical protein
MQPFYQNTSCSPFYDLDQPCKLGSYAVYSISVSGPKDVVAGLKFARDHNVRLVIRNTGHEYVEAPVMPQRLRVRLMKTA